LEDDKENPNELPPEQILKLRPLVVEELNHRNRTAKLGDRLERMLDEGLEVSSTSFAPQNVPIILRWLAVLMAVVGLYLMFVWPRAIQSIPKLNAYYLDKLIACVRRWRESGELFTRSRRGSAR